MAMIWVEPMTGADCGLLQPEPVFVSSARLGELSWNLCRDELPPHLPGFPPWVLQQTSFSGKTVLYLNMILSCTGTQHVEVFPYRIHRTRGSERGFDSSSLSWMYSYYSVSLAIWNVSSGIHIWQMTLEPIKVEIRHNVKSVLKA